MPWRMRISARRAPPVAHAYLEWAAPSCKAYPSVALVTDAEAATIRVFYEQRGEFAAAVELRRLFPAVTVNAQAQECARAIAGWQPLPPAALPSGSPKLAHTGHANARRSSA